MTERVPTDRWLAAAIVASNFGPPFLFSGVAVALPAMGKELGASATELGLVETTFLCSSLALLLPVGRLADASDKRTWFLCGLVAFAVLSLVIAASSSMGLILWLRALQGAASATYTATGFAVLADVVGPERRARAFGAAIGVTYAGLSFGPLVAGVLVGHFGWRSVFVFGALLILCSSLVVFVRLPRHWRAPERVLHGPSVLLLAAAVAAAAFGSAVVHRGVFGVSVLAVALAFAVSFVVVQLRTNRPLLDLRAVAANGPLRAALLVQLVLYCTAFCSTFLLSLWLQAVRHVSPDRTGLVIAAGGLLMAIVAPIAGRLGERVAPTKLTFVGVAFVLLATLLARTLDGKSETVWALAVLGLQAVGFGLFSTPNMARIMSSLPGRQSTMASALAAMARSVGMVSGMLLTNGAIALACGDGAAQAHPDEFGAAMRGVYSVLACTAVLALALSARDLWPARQRSV
ncbi:MAG: MFS transporter [Planctomycetota bacterium]